MLLEILDGRGARRAGWALLALLLATCASVGASRAAAQPVFYLGGFAGSVPADDVGCGTGKGVAPAPHPCATLAYWNERRAAAALAGGGTVRVAPGVHAAASAFHCVVAQSNVTYEGRTADDQALDEFDSVVIDASGTSYAAPCWGRSLIPKGATARYPDRAVAALVAFTLRDMTLRNAPADDNNYRAGALLYGGPGTSGLTIDRVRFTGNTMGGLEIGQRNWRQLQCAQSGAFCATAGQDCGAGTGLCTDALDYDCAFTRRDTTNVVVVDSQFDGNSIGASGRGSGGLSIGCVQGFSVARGRFFLNRVQSDDCCLNASSAGCDGKLGFSVTGGRDGMVTDIEVFHNGEGDIESGSTRTYATRNVVYDRIYWHDTLCSTRNDSKRAGFKVVGAVDVTLRNSYGIGPYGHTLQSYNCAVRFRMHNNTIWQTQRADTSAGIPVSILNGCRDCEFTNNLIRTQWGNAKRIAAELDPRSTTAGARWEHNLLLNDAAGGSAIAEVDDGTAAGCPEKCAPAIARGEVACAAWNPSCGAVPCILADDAAGLARFRSEGDAGHWFGPESGDTDVWGAVPAVVGPADPTPANLHLQAADVAARGKGAVLPGFDVDWDGQRRSADGVWDIGADEYVAGGAPAPPRVLDATPVP